MPKVIVDVSNVLMNKIDIFLLTRNMPRGNKAEKVVYAVSEFVKIVDKLNEKDVFDIDHLIKLIK